MAFAVPLACSIAIGYKNSTQRMVGITISLAVSSIIIILFSNLQAIRAFLAANLGPLIPYVLVQQNTKLLTLPIVCSFSGIYDSWFGGRHDRLYFECFGVIRLIFFGISSTWTYK